MKLYKVSKTKEQIEEKKFLAKIANKEDEKRNPALFGKGEKRKFRLSDKNEKIPNGTSVSLPNRDEDGVKVWFPVKKEKKK
jgi:hypothetical protein